MKRVTDFLDDDIEAKSYLVPDDVLFGAELILYVTEKSSTNVVLHSGQHVE